MMVSSSIHKEIWLVVVLHWAKLMKLVMLKDLMVNLQLANRMERSRLALAGRTDRERENPLPRSAEEERG